MESITFGGDGGDGGGGGVEGLEAADMGEEVKGGGVGGRGNQGLEEGGKLEDVEEAVEVAREKVGFLALLEVLAVAGEGSGERCDLGIDGGEV